MVKNNNNNKTSLGRRKISIEKIQKKNHLQVTFSKRRAGLFKKASELCTLCGVEIAILVFSPAHKPFSFGHPDVDSILDRFLARNPPQDSTSAGLKFIQEHRNANVRDLNERLEQVLAHLESETKHGEALDRMRKVSESQNWWEAPVEKLGFDELQQLKDALEVLKQVVTQQTNKIIPGSANSFPYLAGKDGVGVHNSAFVKRELFAYICIGFEPLSRKKEEQSRNKIGSKTECTCQGFIILRAYDGDASLKCCLSDENQTLGWPAGAAGSLVFQGSRVADASSTDLATPAIKFELEPAVIDNNLVHIRSCHNNKYWVRNSPDGHSIVAAAREPQEDQSKWSCSLFKPNLYHQNTIQFIHVQLGCDVSYETTINDSSALCLTSGRDYYTALFRFLDWETLVILPKYVAFKGDNGKYLKAYMERGVPYLQFVGTDLGDPQVGQRIFYRTDGSIMLKNYYFDQYWRSAEHEWIQPDASDGSDKETWFLPVKVDTNVIALRSLANNKFCERQGGEGGEDCLAASVSAINIESRMVVEEQVICRQMYHVRFRLSDARIYDQELLTLATGHVFNGSEESNRVEVKLQYVDSKSSTWCSGVSMNLGVKTFTESGIPFIEKQRVEVSNKLRGSYEWGQPIESSTKVEASYRVDVAANTEMRISLVATKGWCDVPFSYTQRDTLVDGRVIVTRKGDGVYTGSNCYNFMYHLLSPLPPPNPTWP